jgi:hypothetical protein
MFPGGSRRPGHATMRSFILIAATAALIIAGVDGCSRRPHPLRPHKEPHALVVAPGGPAENSLRPAR